MPPDAARHNDNPGLALDRLAAGGAIDFQTPIRRARRQIQRRLLLEAAAGVTILAGLTYAALVAL